MTRPGGRRRRRPTTPVRAATAPALGRACVRASPSVPSASCRRRGGGSAVHVVTQEVRHCGDVGDHPRRPARRHRVNDKTPARSTFHGRRRSSRACAHHPQVRHIRHQPVNDSTCSGSRRPPRDAVLPGSFRRPTGVDSRISSRDSLYPVGSAAVGPPVVCRCEQGKRVLAAPAETTGSGEEVEGARDASTRCA